jgi:lipid II:glycine glycyltransferase (peptidoglycan interpeptide bridge formation enzyme)
MPAHTFGGWVSETSLTKEHARQLAACLFTMRDLVWRENPYDPVLGSIEIVNGAYDFTQTIDLRQGFAAAKMRSDYSHRRAVRAAVENGVSIVEASNADQWQNYFSLYKASQERWGRRNLFKGRGYDRALFRAIYESPAEHRKLWLAHVNGTPVAGTLCFYWNRHAVSWSSAGDAEFFKKFRPNDLLIDHVVRHAAETGYDWYDCNPSAGLKGVVEFKEHIGAQKIRSRIINNRSLLRRAAEYLRSRFS